MLLLFFGCRSSLRAAVLVGSTCPAGVVHSQAAHTVPVAGHTALVEDRTVLAAGRRVLALARRD